MGGNLTSGVAKKPGGAGQQEAYNPKDGKYVAESGISDQDLIDEINKGANGFFGQKAKDKYDSLDADGKKTLIEKLQEAIRGQKTNISLGERFTDGTMSEFQQWGAECDSKFSQEELDSFYRGYMGAGYRSFEFNKALRLGFTEFYKKFPQFANDYGLSQTAIEDRVAKLDKLTNGFQIPRNISVYRYVDENYLVSQFEQYLTGLDILPDDGYGYRTLDRNAVSVQDLANKLSQAIGDRIPQDNGFTSFSVVPKQTHMGKHSGADTYKRIHLKYDCKKGTNCYISQYQRESEGLFPRNTSFYVKDVKVETGDDGNERVVIYYGVEQK